MKVLSTESAVGLIVQEHTCCKIENLQLEISSYLGQFADIHYFQVLIYNLDPQVDPDNDKIDSSNLGLMRVGSIDGGLKRELELRKVLGDRKMVSQLLAVTEEESVSISSRSHLSELEISSEQENLEPHLAVNPFNVIEELSGDELVSNELSPLHDLEELSGDELVSNEPNVLHSLEDNSVLEPEYLEEEFYPEEEIFDSSARKLILLSDLPQADATLETWLKQENSLESSLVLASQACQFFRHVYQQQWCFIQIFPQFVQMGTPVKFFDLTGAYPVEEKLTSSFLGGYCAPEIAYNSGCTINEQMSTYTVGALLYQAIHQKLPPQTYGVELEIKRIPPIYQFLKICLSPIPEERFSLSQLLSLLVETRKSILNPHIHWDAYGRSTIGLSTSRLQNEDSFGVQQYFSNWEPTILGVVADGMGGMAQGEIASKLALQTVLESQIPLHFTSQQRAEWLIELVQKANACVTDNVRDGGTTLSLVMAIGRDLATAHVGDSRIFLLRNKQICQLSEDHSMVATLLAGGQITYEESQVHPDRNVLTKSLGSKRKLSDRYVQDLSLFGSDLSLPMENGDILLLCSDGVWDLVSADELAENFSGDHTIHAAVELTIEQVLARGATDNATILALRCTIKNSY